MGGRVGTRRNDLILWSNKFFIKMKHEGWIKKKQKLNDG